MWEIKWTTTVGPTDAYEMFETILLFCFYMMDSILFIFLRYIKIISIY